MHKLKQFFVDLNHNENLWKLYRKNNHDYSAQYELIRNATQEEIKYIEIFVNEHNYKYRKYSSFIIIPPNKLFTLYKLSDNGELKDDNIVKYGL